VKRLNSRLDAGRIGVCPVLDTDVADCLLVAMARFVWCGVGRQTEESVPLGWLTITGGPLPGFCRSVHSKGS